MVLGELGQKLSSALQRLNARTVIDDELVDSFLKDIAKALLEADVNVKYVSEMRGRIKNQLKLDEAMCSGTNRRKFVQKCVCEELASLLTASKKPLKLQKGKPNVIMFVGLQGSGKTTTCTKYAAYYKRKGWKVALVCADTFRAGAFDQLKQNATKCCIPFYGSYTESDPVSIASEGVEMFRSEKYDIIVVDTSGRHKQEASLFEEMQQVEEVVQPDDIVFVMDSHIGQACFDQAKAFADSVKVGSVIITKLDGHAKGGGALSAVAATHSPIIFIGTGEHFEDFEQFNAQSFVSRLCGLGDISGLVNTINEVMPLDKQPELQARLAKGQFTFRDMYEQLQYVRKLGSLGQVMSMIPGMSSSNMPEGYEKQGVQRISRFLTIMDSMNDEELDCKKGVALDKDLSRVIRVARGSGVHPMDVAELIHEHKRFEKMVGKMGKAGLMNESGDMTNMTRNPKQVMAKLQNCVDPMMLQQMGGVENMFNMMKQMEEADEKSGNKQKLKKAVKDLKNEKKSSK
jgi:signal recognition particle subunit SRP54|mmetsp:Transcript_74412/g.116406  ORF Transcript_74412/g.116406 Transcript_74412/m.116406 type:complete len:515 (-) Transcript_74412:105-1649(-)